MARVHDFAVGSAPAAVAVSDSVVRGYAVFCMGNGRRAQKRDREEDAEHLIFLIVMGLDMTVR
jgi:hypothetical protein